MAKKKTEADAMQQVAAAKASKKKKTAAPEVKARLGRPSLLGEPVRPKQVYMPESCAVFLEALGNGNVSAGIREAARKSGWKPKK